MVEHWALPVATMEYLPIGFGSHHWGVVAAGRRWFLTVDDLDVKQRSRSATRDDARRRLHAALTTAHQLADDGVRFVVAPVLTEAGDVLVDVGDRFAAALYPYVEGEPRDWDDYRTRAERLDVLELVVELHASPRRQACVEDLSIAMLDELELAIDQLDRPWTSGPYSERARQLLLEHTEPLLRLIDTYQGIAREVLAGHERFVLTHGEPHPGNTLVTERGLLLIDWDTALIAPPERDLWTVAGDDDGVTDAYTAATGTPVDPNAIGLLRRAVGSRRDRRLRHDAAPTARRQRRRRRIVAQPAPLPATRGPLAATLEVTPAEGARPPLIGELPSQRRCRDRAVEAPVTERSSPRTATCSSTTSGAEGVEKDRFRTDRWPAGRTAEHPCRAPNRDRAARRDAQRRQRTRRPGCSGSAWT